VSMQRSDSGSVHSSALLPEEFRANDFLLSHLDIACTIHSNLWDEPLLAINSGGLFSTASRSRCYCTNLRGHKPITSYASCVSVKPVQEFLGWPSDRPWPAWASTAWFDNCLRAIVGLSCASPRSVTQIKQYIKANPGTRLHKPSEKDVLKKIRVYNLVPSRTGTTPDVLSVEKVEELMGFSRGHTGSCDQYHTTDHQRRKMLGDSFQVDTVAYLLTPILDLQRAGKLPPEGITVLSLFDGIGGALVALHKIGVRLNRVITCEKDELRRMVVRNWMQKHAPRAIHIEMVDIRDASKGPSSTAFIRNIMNKGPIHLVIGGSPCQNISMLNRVSSDKGSGRSGFSGDDSHLFFSYVTILRKCKEEHERRGRRGGTG